MNPHELWNEHEAKILAALEKHTSIKSVEMAFGFSPGSISTLQAGDLDVDVKVRGAIGRRAIKDGEAIAKQIDDGDANLALKVRERLEPDEWQPTQKVITEGQTTHIIMSEEDAEKI